MKRLLFAGVMVLLLALLILQIIPVQRDNPAVTRAVHWDSDQTQALARRACMDCHSNETVWPWYSGIAPVKFILANHVHEGRGELNFSEWDRPNTEYEEIQETIQEGEMPPWDYVMMHPEAKLTPTETRQLMDGLRATYQQDTPVQGEREGRGDDDD